MLMKARQKPRWNLTSLAQTNLSMNVKCVVIFVKGDDDDQGTFIHLDLTGPIIILRDDNETINLAH